MKEAWRRCAEEIRAKSGLGTGRLERAMGVGDGTGRNWRSWMTPEPPMARKWPELVTRALERGWLTLETARAMLDAAQAAYERLEKFRQMERQRRAAAAIPPRLPFDVPPVVPPDVLPFWYFRTGAAGAEVEVDSWTAAHTLVRAAIEAARRTGRGKGSGGRAAWERRCLEATVEGRAWLKAVAALESEIERLGLGVVEPRRPGRPTGNPRDKRQAAEGALVAALQAAYERAGYPPPPPQI